MNPQKVYCVTVISGVTGLEGEISIDVVGVFSTRKEALSIASEMQEAQDVIGGNTLKPKIETVYDVFDFTVDATPIMLTYQRKRLEQIADTNDKVDEVLTTLMKNGLVDQLIGEDGKFYYELTSDGRKEAKKIPELVKKLFKKD